MSVPHFFLVRPRCPQAGLQVTSFCSGCDYYVRYTNGICGTYDTLVEGNSCTYCGCCGLTLSITLDCTGDAYLCVSGPCGNQQDDDSAGNLDSLVQCTSAGTYYATAGAYSTNATNCAIMAGTGGAYSSNVFYQSVGNGSGRCTGTQVSFYWGG